VVMRVATRRMESIIGERVQMRSQASSLPRLRDNRAAGIHLGAFVDP